jgi:hypothetical protein
VAIGLVLTLAQGLIDGITQPTPSVSTGTPANPDH